MQQMRISIDQIEIEDHGRAGAGSEKIKFAWNSAVESHPSSEDKLAGITVQRHPNW